MQGDRPRLLEGHGSGAAGDLAGFDGEGPAAFGHRDEGRVAPVGVGIGEADRAGGPAGRVGSGHLDAEAGLGAARVGVADHERRQPSPGLRLKADGIDVELGPASGVGAGRRHRHRCERREGHGDGSDGGEG
jgi:hypothetical protein